MSITVTRNTDQTYTYPTADDFSIEHDGWLWIHAGDKAVAAHSPGWDAVEIGHNELQDGEVDGGDDCGPQPVGDAPAWPDEPNALRDAIQRMIRDAIRANATSTVDMWRAVLDRVQTQQ